MKQEDINKELSELAPFLNSIPKDSERCVPEGYFEKLPSNTWNKIRDYEKDDSSNVRSITLKLLALAASFVLLFLVINAINDTAQMPDEIPMDAFVDFVMEDIDDIDESLLFDLHTSTLDLVEIEDENLEYILEEGIDEIDDQFLETLY